MNYFPGENLPEKDNYKIAKYAYGKDYHDVIREKLNKLINRNKEAITGNASARAFTDSAPVMEKAWAERAGLGWRGKNTCLILHPEIGSFFFIGEIITDLELEYDERKGQRSLRQLHPLHRCLPDRGYYCTPCARCTQMHLLFYHRIQGRITGR